MKGAYSFQRPLLGARVSRIGVGRILLLATMFSFGAALLRNATFAGVFELLKFPMLAASISYLFFLRPVIRFTTSAMLSWSFVALVAISSVYNSASSSALIPSVAVFLIIGVYFQAVSNLTKPENILLPVLRLFSIGVVTTSAIYVLLPGSFIGGRFAAGFINTNVASGFLAIAVVTMSHMVIFEKPRPVSILALVAALLFLLLTKGRGALIAAAVPVVIMLLADRKQKSQRVNFIRLVAIGLVIWLYQMIQIGDTTDATQLGLLSYRAFELGARDVIIARHFDAFWQSPFVGAGAVIDDLTPFARTSGESSYTDLLALSGGIGMALISALILRALWMHWRHSESRLGFSVLLSALLLAASEGYFVSIASAVSMILWGLLAMSPSKSVAR